MILSWTNSEHKQLSCHKLLLSSPLAMPFLLQHRVGNLQLPVNWISVNQVLSSNSPCADPLFWLHLGEKTSYGFLVTSGCLLSRKVWWVFQNGSFCPKLSYFTYQNGPKGGPHQNEFWLFPNTKMNVTDRVEKVDETNGIICVVSMFPSCVMVCKLSKKWYFLQLWAELSKKSKSVKAIYKYATESSH